ncbi:hypothetical protein ZEAMMB73_Zm00001d017471 [Zea mays]|uniref:No apical meristem-associated C-terminal domain-containing protein n=1 Tax=Zea mays TaxID=4577 RepID=A0A1D6HF05_MAIZE|nr:hypothetical protein ZEAMMB73_Zm00001d017471 [Zea mays]
MDGRKSTMAGGSNTSQFPNIDTWNFDGCYYNITEGEDSHHNEHVHELKDAMKMFEGLQNHPFLFTHCWILLRNERKWRERSTATRPGRVVNEDQPTNMFPSSEPEVSISPEGRDSCKRKRANKNTTSADSTACVEVLKRMTKNRELVEVKCDGQYKELLARRDHELDLKEQEMEFKIMAVNIDEVAEEKRAYYRNMQRRIIEKSNKDNNSST